MKEATQKAWRGILDLWKLILESWKVLVPVVAIFGSSLGWTVADNMDKDTQLVNKDKQIAAVATYSVQRSSVQNPEPCNCAILEHRIKRLEEYH